METKEIFSQKEEELRRGERNEAADRDGLTYTSMFFVFFKRNIVRSI